MLDYVTGKKTLPSPPSAHEMATPNQTIQKKITGCFCYISEEQALRIAPRGSAGQLLFLRSGEQIVARTSLEEVVNLFPVSTSENSIAVDLHSEIENMNCPVFPRGNFSDWWCCMCIDVRPEEVIKQEQLNATPGIIEELLVGCAPEERIDTAARVIFGRAAE